MALLILWKPERLDGPLRDITGLPGQPRVGGQHILIGQRQAAQQLGLLFGGDVLRREIQQAEQLLLAFLLQFRHRKGFPEQFQHFVKAVAVLPDHGLAVAQDIVQIPVFRLPEQLGQCCFALFQQPAGLAGFAAVRVDGTEVQPGVHAAKVP